MDYSFSFLFGVSLLFKSMCDGHIQTICFLIDSDDIESIFQESYLLHIFIPLRLVFHFLLFFSHDFFLQIVGLDDKFQSIFKLFDDLIQSSNLFLLLIYQPIIFYILIRGIFSFYFAFFKIRLQLFNLFDLALALNLLFLLKLCGNCDTFLFPICYFLFIGYAFLIKSQQLSIEFVELLMEKQSGIGGAIYCFVIIFYLMIQPLFQPIQLIIQSIDLYNFENTSAFNVFFSCINSNEFIIP